MADQTLPPRIIMDPGASYWSVLSPAPGEPNGYLMSLPEPLAGAIRTAESQIANGGDFNVFVVARIPYTPDVRVILQIAPDGTVGQNMSTQPVGATATIKP